MKWSAFLVLVFAGLVMAYSAPELPPFRSADSPPSLHVSPRYIEQGPKETYAPNMVTGVIADYRAFDTLFEAVVIFIGGIATALVLWPRHRESER